MLEKGLRDNWKRDDDRKGSYGLVSRLYILRNSTEKEQMHVKRRTNEQLPGIFLVFSPFILGLMGGRQTERRQTALKILLGAR